MAGSISESGGSTPLLVATMRGQVALALYLLEQGADPNVAAAGWTALPWVSTAWETGTANRGKCHAKDQRGRMART